MTVKDFDHYLVTLALNPPNVDFTSPGSKSFVTGFRFAIWLIRKFIRENLHEQKKAS